MDLGVEPVGLVAYSFAMRDADREPNPCNVKLGQQAIAISQRLHQPLVTVAQWEVARSIDSVEIPIAGIVYPRGAEYLSTDGVWEAAKEIFVQQRVRRVIVVANPFLHLRHARHMAQQDGYQVIRTKIETIGFDNSPANHQWWTRGPVRLLTYSAFRAVRPTKTARDLSQASQPSYDLARL